MMYKRKLPLTLMRSIMTVLTFALSSMLLLAPGRDHTVLAQAVSDVVEAERPLFQNDEDKLRTTSLIIAIAFREGSLRTSVVGDCDGSKPGECKGRARSFCTAQIHESNGGSEWLNENPLLCIQKELAMLRVSFRTCAAFPVAWYASGPNGCTNERAQRISKDRMNLAHWLWTKREKQPS